MTLGDHQPYDAGECPPSWLPLFHKSSNGSYRYETLCAVSHSFGVLWHHTGSGSIGLDGSGGINLNRTTPASEHSRSLLQVVAHKRF